MNTQLDIVLASGSPRRKELLASTGLPFRVVVSDADETAPEDVAPSEVAMGNAQAKALAVTQDLPASSVVIGADTIVVLDGRIFGKPRDAADAKRMLRELSGRTHEVITGVCIVRDGSPVILNERSESKNPAKGRDLLRDPSTSALRASAQDDGEMTLPDTAQDDGEVAACDITTFAEVTRVSFKNLSDDEIDAYVASGEPLDKAGAYGIQGGAGVFVERVDGDYDNVVGLPVRRLQRALDLESGD